MTSSKARPRVGLLGLGNMGSALADRLIAGSMPLTLWNRSPDKAQAYQEKGAAVVKGALDAAVVCDTLLVCLRDHAATRDTVMTWAMADALKGKTLVELTSMTAAHSRSLDAWAENSGIAYLEGQIQDYPATVRAGTATLICAGPKAVFERCRPVLETLTERTVFTSEVIDTAPTLVNVQLAFSFMAYAGVLHGVAVCQEAGVPVERFLETMVRDNMTTGPMADDLEIMGRAADTRAFDDDVGATMEIWQASLEEIIREGRETGITTSHLEAVSTLMTRDHALGHDGHDMAGLIDAIRPGT